MMNSPAEERKWEKSKYTVKKLVHALARAHRGFAWQEQWILFPMGTNVLSNAKRFHCSCYATWLPCKTSIEVWALIKRRPCWVQGIENLCFAPPKLVPKHLNSRLGVQNLLSMANMAATRIRPKVLKENFKKLLVRAAESKLIVLHAH